MLCRMNIIQPDLQAARSQHTPVTGRTSKEKKTEEKRASLKRTSVTCKRITEMALASAAKNYTRQGMEAVRSARRPEAITNRKRETDTFQAKVDADLRYWGKKQRTVDEEKLAATAATMSTATMSTWTASKRKSAPRSSTTAVTNTRRPHRREQQKKQRLVAAALRLVAVRHRDTTSNVTVM